MTLDEYFASVTRFAYGEMDCCLWPAGWVQAQTGQDPAAIYRGRYDDEAGAKAFAEEAGGVHRVIDRCARAAGMRRTWTPRNGDVGCVAVNGQLVGAIMKNGSWWVVNGAGKFPAPNARLVIAWCF
jgi:hypothetical protein